MTIPPAEPTTTEDYTAPSAIILRPTVLSDLRDKPTVMDDPFAAAAGSAIADPKDRTIATVQSTFEPQRRIRTKNQTSEAPAFVPVIKERGHNLEESSSPRPKYSRAQPSETVTAREMSKGTSRAASQPGQVEDAALASSQGVIKAPAPKVKLALTRSTSPPGMSVHSDVPPLSQLDAQKVDDRAGPASIGLGQSAVDKEPSLTDGPPLHVDTNSMSVPVMEDPCSTLHQVSTKPASTRLPSQLSIDASIAAPDPPTRLMMPSKTFHQIPTIVPSTRGTSVKAQLTRLGQRVPCVVCYETSSHIQKNCPRVKAGVEGLRGLLDEREKEESGPATEASINAIKVWIERLTTVRNKVMGLENGQIGRTSPETMRPPQSKQVPEQGQKRQSAKLDIEAGAAPAAEVSHQVPHPQPQIPVLFGQTVRPESAKDGLEETKLHPLYLKALSRPPRSGTVSRLSASDAVIETGGSDDAGSSDRESNDSGTTEESSDDASDSEDNIDETEDSVSADESGDGGTNSNQSEREENITSPSSRSSKQSTRSDLSFRQVLKKPMTEAQKKAARESAASIRPVDLTTDIDEDVSDVAASASSDERPAPKAASESSIGDFAEGEDDHRTSGSSAVKTSTQPPMLIGKAASSSPQSRQSSRSFTALEKHAGETPKVDVFEGAVVLREAIEAEELPERMAMADVLVNESIAKNLDVPRSHVISQGPPSPPTSHDDDVVSETLSKRLSQINTTKRTLVAKKAITPQVEGLLAASVDFDHPSSNRRLRSASREMAADVPPRDKMYDRNPPVSSQPAQSTGSPSLSEQKRNDRLSSEANQRTRSSITPSPQHQKSNAGHTTPSQPRPSSIESESESGPHLETSRPRGTRTPIQVRSSTANV